MGGGGEEARIKCTRGEIYQDFLKPAIYGAFVRHMRKDVRYCFDKNHDERLESKLE